MKPFELTEIDLDKKRHMLLDVPALKLAEREINRFRMVSRFEWLGIDFYVGQAKLQMLTIGHLPIDVCEILLWASLTYEDGLITVDTVGKMITDRDYVEAKIIECLDNNWPAKPANEAEANPEDPEKKVAQPNGATSGPLPGSS